MTTRSSFTLRLDPAERNALKHLSKIVRRPVNQLVIEAVKNYLRQKGSKELRLEESLTTLRAYRKRDPGFKRAIAALVESEASFKDPLEGKALEEEAEDRSNAAGPVQTKMREVLGAGLERR